MGSDLHGIVQYFTWAQQTIATLYPLIDNGTERFWKKQQMRGEGTSLENRPKIEQVTVEGQDLSL